jgi:HEAT repeat protein
MKTKPIRIACAVILLSACAAAAQPFTADHITETLKQLRTYDYAVAPAPVNTIENMIRFALDKPELRAVLEDQMIALLESDAAFRAKQYVCHQLWIIGTDKSLPILEKMLLKKDTAEIACFALRTHPSEGAGRILRAALARVDDETKVCVINILGDRQDAAAVDQLMPLLKSGNPAVAETAAISLGAIGGDKAAAAIATARNKATGPMRTVLTRAWLRCAEQFAETDRPQDALAVYKHLFAPSEPLFVRRSALVSALNTGDPAAIAFLDAALSQNVPVLRAAAIANSHLLEGPRVTRRLASALDTADAETQVLVIEALARRNDRAVKGTVTTAAGSPHADVRIAAYNALATVGDASSAALLCAALPKANTTTETETILAALRRMHAKDVDRTITDQIANTDAGGKVQLIAVISDRRYRPAAPTLLALARDENTEVAKAGLKALAVLATAAELPALIDIMTECTDDAVRDEAVRTITAVAQASDTTPAIEAIAKRLDASTSTPEQIALVKVLSALPSATSLERLEAAVNSPDPQVWDAAIRALAQYHGADAASPLLEIFKTATDPTYRAIALRGLIRLCKTADVPAPKALTFYTDALASSTTPAEKILILSGLAQIAHPDAFKLGIPLLDDETVKTEAALALLTIAENAPGLDRETVAAALKKILADDALKHLAPRATTLLNTHYFITAP